MSNRWFRSVLLLLVIGLLGSLIYRSVLIDSNSLQIGDTFLLSELLDSADKPKLKAHYYLVKFWGSWCAPCRREHPNWIQVHKKYSDHYLEKQGIAVLGVALEADSSAWLEAVKKDRLPWEAHILQPRDLKSGFAGRLQIPNVPYNILVDSSSQVVGIDMRPEEVERFIRHRLTK
ncbi:MAG: redoxin domain-containing protein [Bacteroidetes bacterium]|nr:redoxin domain-containing protein [Bacteroidota bacterium]